MFVDLDDEHEDGHETDGNTKTTFLTGFYPNHLFYKYKHVLFLFLPREQKLFQSGPKTIWIWS